MEDSKIRQSINAFSHSRDGHPYLDYGNKIKIIGNEECPVMSCSLHTQYESRSVYKTIRPHLGSPLSPRTITDFQSVDPWKMDIEEPNAFVKEDNEYTVKGSQWVATCNTCNGKGQSTCPDCKGYGRETCPSCNGSKKQTCKSCSGTGYVLCPDCKGTRTITCEKCNGKGTISYVVREQKYEYDFQQKKQVLKYVDVTKTKNCEACSGRGTWRCGRCRDTIEKKGYIRCKACGNMGYVTCSTCNGNGELVCKTCSGGGKLICKTCEGHCKMLHGIAVGQHLDDNYQRKYIGDNRVLDLAQKIQLYGKYLLKERDAQLGKNLIPNEPKCNAIINGFLDQTGRSDAEILFQEAKVMRCPMYFITYSFEGQTYTGVIHNDRFYPNGSPIDDYAQGLVDKATRKANRGSSTDALRALDEAEIAGANKRQIASLREKAEQHLDVLYKTGVDIVFWLLALFFTPVLFNFYSNINPVAKWAIMANNPTWSGYHLVAVTQCVVFLLAIFVLKRYFGQRNRGGHRFRSIWAYLIMGMAKYLGLSFIILLVLLALNYFGFSILTALIAIIVGWVLKIVFVLIFWAILLVKTLIEKIF